LRLTATKRIRHHLNLAHAIGRAQVSKQRWAIGRFPRPGEIFGKFTVYFFKAAGIRHHIRT